MCIDSFVWSNWETKLKLYLSFICEEVFSSGVEGEGEAVFGGRPPSPPHKQNSIVSKRKAELVSLSLKKAKKGKLSSTQPRFGDKDVLVKENSSGESIKPQTLLQHSGQITQPKPPATHQKGSAKLNPNPTKSTRPCAIHGVWCT